MGSREWGVGNGKGAVPWPSLFPTPYPLLPYPYFHFTTDACPAFSSST